jgi:hypothetical protein
MLKKTAEKIVFVGLLLCCGLLLVCAGCEKDDHPGLENSEFAINKSYERGSFNVHLRLNKKTMTIAETVLLNFEATIESGYEVEFPEIGKVLVNFGIVDWKSFDDRLDENNNIVRSYQYRLEPFLSGNYQLPAFTFVFYKSDGSEDQKHELTTEPVDIEVTSLLGEDRAKLVIDDIEDVVELPGETSFLWIWLIIVIAVVAAVIAIRLYLRRKRVAELVKIYKSAHEIAYDRLRILVKDDPVKAGRIKEFYERISDILRHYIEHRFELKAPERTTEEFLFELQYTDVLSGTDKDNLKEFLTHCDLVKFAKHSPTTQQIQRTFDLVKDFIEKTKSRDRQIDVTDTAVAGEATILENA